MKGHGLLSICSVLGSGNGIPAEPEVNEAAYGLLILLGGVMGVPHGFHGMSISQNCLLYTAECGTVSICSHMANECGFSVC